MRKIISKQKEEKDKKIKQYLIGGILIFVMLFSTLGFAFQGKSSDESSEIEINGFEFVSQGEFWILQKENLNFIFKNNPKQIERINSDINPIEKYQGQPLYIYSESKDAELEIYRNLNPRNNQIIQRINPACPESSILNISEKKSKCEENIPIKNCDNNFIIIIENNITQITQNKNCVILQGPKTKLRKITDEFLFKLLEIV